MGLQQGASLVEGDGVLQRRLAALELPDNALQLGKRLFKGKICDVCAVRHGIPRPADAKLVMPGCTRNAGLAAGGLPAPKSGRYGSPMTQISLRRAQREDAALLSRLGRETFVETFGHLYPADDLAAYLNEAYDLKATRTALLSSTSASWIVERHSGEALGYATAGPCGLPHPEVSDRSLELKRIYLLGAAQGAGVGGELFDTVLAWMAAQAPRDLWIGVWSENLGAQRFYARRGFEKVGEYGFPVGRTLDREFILRRRPAF